MIDLLNLGTLTSHFGNRDAPTSGASTNHKGIDIVLNDSSIPAVTGGEVIDSGYDSGMGNYIKIKDSNGYTHTYMHMASKSKYVAGSQVKEGSTIGTMGSTGISTGDHLHYQVQDSGGTFLDPEKYLSGATGVVSGGGGSSDNDYGLKWWGDIVKVVLCGLLIITGIVMFASGVLGSSPVKKLTGGKKK